MAIETANYVNQLVPTNPATTDPVSEGAAQIQLVKNTLVQTLPNFGAALNSTPAAIDSTVTGWNGGNIAIPAVTYTDTTGGHQGRSYTNTAADGGVGLITADSTNYVYVNDTLVSTPKALQVGGNAIVGGSLQVPTITGATNFNTKPTVAGVGVATNNIPAQVMSSSMQAFCLSVHIGDGANLVQTLQWATFAYVWVPFSHTWTNWQALSTVAFICQINGGAVILDGVSNSAGGLGGTYGPQYYIFQNYGNGGYWGSLNMWGVKVN